MNQRPRIRTSLFMLAVVAFPAIPPSAVAETVVVATLAADYASGAHSVIDVDPLGGPLATRSDRLPTIFDIMVAAHENYFCRVERHQGDNVTRFDVAAPDSVNYIYSVLDNGILWITPQRSDQHNGWTPSNTACAALFDTATNQEIDTGIATIDPSSHATALLVDDDATTGNISRWHAIRCLCGSEQHALGLQSDRCGGDHPGYGRPFHRRRNPHPPRSIPDCLCHWGNHGQRLRRG